MKHEIRRTIRTKLIARYYSSINITSENPTMVTGALYAVTDTSNEILIFQADTPITREAFETEVAKLQTALSETWFTLPIEYGEDAY